MGEYADILKSDENAVGFSVLICGIGRGEKTFIRCLRRAKAGEPLKEITIEDASKAQLCAALSALDSM